MDLAELSLLRGWINHLEWTELAEQVADGSESAAKRIKRLRRQLAVKAQFYGKTEQIALWRGERGSTESWQRRCLTALSTLNSLPDPVPDLAQDVTQWFAESLSSALPRQVKTLAELVDWLEAGFAGDFTLPEKLKPELNTLTRFFAEHAQVLGYSLNRKPASTSLPVPLQQVAPLERVIIPIELNGEHGTNRSPQPCRINAQHDLEAIHSWLALKDGNAKTYTAYKKELERLLLWAVLDRGKALSSLNTDDCKAYVHFLKTLSTTDSQWVTLAPAIKGQGSWKPFTYRIPKAQPDNAPDQTNGEAVLVLSPRSVNYAKSVITSCLDWLVKQQYLQHNNFDGVANIKVSQAKLQASNRAFTLTQMQRVLAYAEAKVKPESASFY